MDHEIRRRLLAAGASLQDDVDVIINREILSQSVRDEIFARLDGLLSEAESMLSASSPEAVAKLFHTTSDWFQGRCMESGCDMLIGMCEVRLASIQAKFLANHPELLATTLNDDALSEYSESDFESNTNSLASNE
jgi:hypothetical protein